MSKSKKLAELINGREIGKEVDKEIEEFAKENELVIIYGASDDLAEIEGAIYDEVGVSDGGLIYFNGDDIYRSECEDERCPHEVKIQENCKTVEAVWNENNISWTYKTEIPHEIFKIMEDGEIY